MGFKIERTKESEAGALLKIQRKAFEADLKTYGDVSPAAETLEFFKFRMQHSKHFTIFIDGKMAGGICIVKVSDSHYRLFRIFLSPEYQKSGWGSKILPYLEKRYPQIKTWSLDTPQKNKITRKFYEKLGYVKVGKTKVNEQLTLIEYEKKIT